MNSPFARLLVGALTIVFVATAKLKNPAETDQHAAPEYPAELVDTG